MESSSPQKNLSAYEPNAYHFIWLGGAIPRDYLINIKNAAAMAREQGIEVCLWVDKESNYHQTSAKEDINVPGLKIRNISELPDEMKKNNFFSEKISVNLGKKNKEMTRGEWLTHFIQQEMVGFKNLAAASDILRYIILYLFSGTYFDCDTKFIALLKNISNALVKKSEFNIKVPGRLQWATTLGGEQYVGGNDMIEVSKPFHEALEKTLSKLIDNYLKLNNTKMLQKKRQPLKEYCENEENRRNLTIAKSGPGMLGKGLIEFVRNNKELIEVKKENENLFAIELTKLSFRPLGLEGLIVDRMLVKSNSDQLWLNPEKKPKDSVQWLYQELKKINVMTQDPKLSDFIMEIEQDLKQKFKHLKVKSPTQDMILGPFFLAQRPEDVNRKIINDLTMEYESELKKHYTELCKKMILFCETSLLSYVAKQKKYSLLAYVKNLSLNHSGHEAEWALVKTLANFYENHDFLSDPTLIDEEIKSEFKFFADKNQKSNLNSFEEPPSLPLQKK